MLRSYGRLSSNLEKRSKHKVIHQDELSELRYQSFIKRIIPVEGEFSTDFVEVISRPRKIKDDVPGKEAHHLLGLIINLSAHWILHFRKLETTYFEVCQNDD